MGQTARLACMGHRARERRGIQTLLSRRQDVVARTKKGGSVTSRRRSISAIGERHWSSAGPCRLQVATATTAILQTRQCKQRVKERSSSESSARPFVRGARGWGTGFLSAVTLRLDSSIDRLLDAPHRLPTLVPSHHPHRTPLPRPPCAPQQQLRTARPSRRRTARSRASSRRSTPTRRQPPRRRPRRARRPRARTATATRTS